ncbi:MAG: hypothetical protein ABI895_22555 [Deltaproteobacteria bacterium]
MTRPCRVFHGIALLALVACTGDGKARPEPEGPQGGESECVFFSTDWQQPSCSCRDDPSLGWCGSMPTPREPRNAHAELVRAAIGDALAYHCGDCHSSLAARELQAEPRALDDLDALVASGQLLPLNSAASPLLQLGASGAMPPPDSGVPPLTQVDLDLLTLFIDSPSFWPGSAALADCAPAPPTTGFDQLFRSVAGDLAALPSSERTFYRYLSLSDRANSLCNETELESERQALFKGLNLLSRGPSLQAPVAVDEARLLYRVDVRGLDWLRGIELRGTRFPDVWEAIAARSPYSVEFSGSDAELAKSATGTAFPLLFADHMLDQALGSELYYAILGFNGESSVGDFIVNDLGVDDAANLEDGLVRRAGTTRSRLAQGDRMVQRQPLAARGALWESFDLDSSGNWTIFEDPIGSVPGPRQLMFTLPNGLFGFISAQANDTLASDTPFQFDLRDTSLPSRGVIMCSGCHASGLLGVVDEVKEVALEHTREIGLNAGEIALLEQTYPEPAVLANQAARDSDAYRQALNALGLPSAGADPVARASLRFDEPLTLRTAAAELGLRPDALAGYFNGLDPALAPLGQGRTLGRDAFARLYVAALCVVTSVSENIPEPAACERLLSPPGSR